MKGEGFRDDPSAISDYPDLIGDSAVILAKERIVPNVIENISDKAAFKVSFGDSGMVTPGQLLSINDIAAEPKVEITDCKSDAVYAFIMVDPDMPSPNKPEYKDVVVWMVTNIKKNDFDSGDFVVEYMGPEPGKGTHRYALLMFEQPGFQQITPPTKRAYFQTKHWTKEHNWEAVAGVYFKVKHGDA